MLLGWLGGKWFSREPGGHTALSLRLERPIWLQPGLLWRMTLYTIPLPLKATAEAGRSPSSLSSVCLPCLIQRPSGSAPLLETPLPPFLGVGSYCCPRWEGLEVVGAIEPAHLNL